MGKVNAYLLQSRVLCSKLFHSVGVAKRVQAVLAGAQPRRDHRNLLGENSQKS